MAFSDRVKEQVNSAPGTSAVTLNGAVTGYTSFFASFANNTIIEGYIIEAVDVNGAPTGLWETGIGLFVTNSTANTLTRSEVFNNSSATQTQINFTSNCFVYCQASACTDIFTHVWGEIGAI